MKNILHELYDGNIYPAELIIPSDPEYRPLNKKIAEEKELLKKKFSKEDIESLSRLEDMVARSTSMEETQAFIYGFKLGSLLMIELFTGEEKISHE